MSSMNRESAIELARKKIEKLASDSEDVFEILLDMTLEIEEGWLFFYNTADFVRTGDPTSALAGNGPLLVTHRGTIHALPSSVPWEEAVKQL